jgi:hypothetical protein
MEALRDSRSSGSQRLPVPLGSERTTKPSTTVFPTPSPLLLRRRRLGRCCSEERERGVSAVGRRRSPGVVGQTR